MRFLGTGAAETLPNPFCHCKVCTQIRQLGHEHYKMRSCFMLSDNAIVDFGADVISLAHRFDLDFNKLEHIFITHTHDDHFSFTNLSVVGMSLSSQKPINIYMSKQAFTWLNKTISFQNPDFKLDLTDENTGVIQFGNNTSYIAHAVQCGTWQTAGDIKYKAVKSTHRAWGEDEYALNYVLQANDKKIMYLCDTGVYSESTLKSLENENADILVMECTFGSKQMPSDCMHLDAYSFIHMLNLFLKHKIICVKTNVYSTHLNHKHDFSSCDLQEFFNKNAPCNVIVAKDGDFV